jgi:lipopolysaccharide transport system ATP-binding protein
MSTLALQVRGVGKRYRIGARKQADRQGLLHRLGALARRSQTDDRTFWALQDVSFEIRHGENVGLIGLNGAGKSTLLKILSRITRPTTGRITVDGRIGALLEVGTGFHGDLTGRENVFLYGSILGMTREEVRRKFDAIVEFSGTGPFIDTPVKRYSSGMYVRLAFSVAAHMEPEILLLDEVLAVGDLPFQRKCMEFAKEMQRRDAAIMFVSHNMFSIKTMCERVIYLRRGRVVYDGPTDEGIRLYEEDCRTLSQESGLEGDGRLTVTSVEVLAEDGTERHLFQYGERMRVRIRYRAHEPLEAPNFIVAVMRADDVSCCSFSTEDDAASRPVVDAQGVVELLTPPIRLVAEMYRIFVLVRAKGFQDLIAVHGPTPIHIAHDLYDTHFGVFHEHGEWRWLDEAGSAVRRAASDTSLTR